MLKIYSAALTLSPWSADRRVRVVSRVAEASASDFNFSETASSLSPLPGGEGELQSISRQIERASFIEVLATTLPLLRGEGQGEGEQRYDSFSTLSNSQTTFTSYINSRTRRSALP